MAESYEVVVIGNAGIDTNVYFYGGTGPDFSVESNYTDNVDYVGQAGGFTSRGLAQLGKRVAFIGHTGADFSGRFVREQLAADGIDISGMFIDPAGTNRSINFMYPDGRRKNFFDGKSHMTLQPNLAQSREILAQSRLAFFSIPNWARQLLPLARQLGLTIACDVQDVVDIDDPYRRDFVEYADILFFSAVNYPDPTPVIRSYLAKNPAQVIVVGLGAQGCAVGTQTGVQFFAPPPLDTPVIDTNGAGDGLAVGFLSSYVLDGYRLEEAVMRGQIAARHTCALRANSSALIRIEELNERFFRLWPGNT